MQQVSTDLPKVIRGKTVDLRRPSIDDLPYIRALWADPETMQDVGGPIELTEDRARQWFERVVDPGGEHDCYFLIVNKGVAPVGEVSYHHFDGETKSAEFNVKIEGRHRFRGYGPEAVRLILGHFFEDRGGESMVDPVALHNVSGQRALQRAGFVRRGADQESVMLEMTKQRYHEFYGRRLRP
jgi:RimJ/RimL family protein N-acetyltransferase